MDACCAWLYSTDVVEGSKTFRRRRISTHACFNLLACFSILWCILLALSLQSRIPPSVFRQAETLPTLNDVLGTLRQAEDRMDVYWMQHPDECGVAASSVGIYKNMVRMHWVDGFDKLLVNMRYKPLQHALQYFVTEQSSLCADYSRRSVTRKRYEAVTVQWQDPDTLHNHELDVIKGTALCVQHFYDIVHGQWPCNYTADELAVMYPVPPGATHEEL